MPGYFSFNPETHDFWPIYNCIKSYYPIGVKKHWPGIYFEYPGIKQMDKITEEMIGNIDNYNRNWTSFQDSVQSNINLKINGTTYGFVPSYSLEVIMEKFEDGNYTRTKTLNLAVSILGNFFTIYGKDETLLLDDRKHYVAINALTVSPYKEFEAIFNKLIILVKERFTGIKFIPHSINRMIVNGLNVRYSDKQECTVYDALFNHLLDDYQKSTVRGDILYGFDEWVVDGAASKESTSAQLLPPPPLW